MKYTPYGSKVLIRPDADEAVTPGGIVVPQSAKVSSRFGVVVARGKRTSQVSKGDRVCYPWGTGDHLNIGEAPHIELDEADIQGIVD